MTLADCLRSVYTGRMQSVLTIETLGFIPEPIRRKFHLEAGTVLEFDEDAPFVKAVPARASAENEQQFDAWLAASTGRARGKLTTEARLMETRGDD